MVRPAIAGTVEMRWASGGWWMAVSIEGWLAWLRAKADVLMSFNAAPLACVPWTAGWPFACSASCSRAPSEWFALLSWRACCSEVWSLPEVWLCVWLLLSSRAAAAREEWVVSLMLACKGSRAAVRGLTTTDRSRRTPRLRGSHSSSSAQQQSDRRRLAMQGGQ